MNCKDLPEGELLNMLKSDTESVVSRVMNCFNVLYYNEFLKVSWNVVFHKRNYSKIFREQMEFDAFNDGLCAFYFFVRDGRYIKGNASLKTVFLEFCKYKLLGHIKKAEVEMIMELKGDPDDIIATINIPSPSETETNDIEKESEKEYTIMHTAMRMLGERCRELIVFRKYKKLSNEEIEKLCGISADNVNNEVYRCFVRLKKNANGLMYNPN